MSDLGRRLNVPINVALHALIHAVVLGLTLWLVLSIWVLFRRSAYVGLNLTMITVFFVIILGLPTLIWLSGRHNRDPNAQGHAENYGNWVLHEFFDLDRKPARQRCGGTNSAAAGGGRVRHDDFRPGVFLQRAAACPSVPATTTARQPAPRPAPMAAAICSETADPKHAAPCAGRSAVAQSEPDVAAATRAIDSSLSKNISVSMATSHCKSATVSPSRLMRLN